MTNKPEFAVQGVNNMTELNFTVDAKEFLKAIKFVTPAISKDKTRANLGVIHFNKKSGQPLSLIATDGHRLHFMPITTTLDGQENIPEFSFSLTPLIISSIAAYIKENKENLEENKLTFFLDLKEETISINNTTLLFKFNDTTFPKFDHLIAPTEDLIPAKLEYYNAVYLSEAAAAFAGLGKKIYISLFFNKNDTTGLNAVYIKASPFGLASTDFNLDAIIIILPLKN